MGEVISLDREREVRRPAPTPEGRRPTPQPVAARRFGQPGRGRELLWREVVGDVLRQERRRQDRTLADVAGRAGMSVQHLSEVERGRKEASSEMLAAASGALGLNLGELARRCASTLGAASGVSTGPVLRAA